MTHEQPFKLPVISPELQKLIRKSPQEYQGFFAAYGTFVQLWQGYELLLEMGIQRELRLSVEEASILCSSLNTQALVNILVALLRRHRSKEEAISAIQEAQKIAERNPYVHSLLLFATNEKDARLVQRSVKDGKYKVKIRPTGKEQMQTHMKAFLLALKKVVATLGLTEAEMDAYEAAIEAHASLHK